MNKMRENKYKAWDTWSNKFFDNNARYGDEVYLSPDGRPYILSSDEGGIHFHPEYNKNRIIFIFYTGLKDKNGVEIYEGDIVKDSDTEYAGNGVVQWKDDDLGFTYTKTFGHIFCKSTMNHFEVIGNIYENPELLEKQ